MKIAVFLAIALNFSYAIAQPNDIDPNWDRVTRAVWSSFRSSPDMVDNCALKIAHDITFNPKQAWPAYCNDFRETPVVQERVAWMKNELSSRKISRSQREQLAKGKIWIGATGKLAELSWGRPKSVNRTTTAGTVSEQWVYPSESYLYLENGCVIAIQN